MYWFFLIVDWLIVVGFVYSVVSVGSLVFFVFFGLRFVIGFVYLVIDFCLVGFCG